MIRRATTRARGRVHEPGAAAGQRAEGGEGEVGEEALPVTPACVYCGAREATTEDHIPPRCLFGQPLPTTLVKVPSCFPCNNGVSKDDE